MTARVAIIIVLSRNVTSGDERHEIKRKREKKKKGKKRDTNNAQNGKHLFGNYYDNYYEDKLMALREPCIMLSRSILPFFLFFLFVRFFIRTLSSTLSLPVFSEIFIIK